MLGCPKEVFYVDADPVLPAPEEVANASNEAAPIDFLLGQYEDPTIDIPPAELDA